MDQLTSTEPNARQIRPVVASAVEIDGEGPSRDTRSWVILHSITDLGLRLIHARSFRAEKLAVRIESPTGEIVQVLVALTSTAEKGDLYETTACFSRSD